MAKQLFLATEETFNLLSVLSGELFEDFGHMVSFQDVSKIESLSLQGVVFF